MSLFVAGAASVQAPMICLFAGGVVFALFCLPAMLFFHLMGWEISNEFWPYFWVVVGWVLLLVSIVSATNAVFCVFRGRDNWLLALGLTQDEKGSIEPEDSAIKS